MSNMPIFGKIIFILDVDGVLLNYHKGFKEWCEKTHNVKINANSTEYNFGMSKENMPLLIKLIKEFNNLDTELELMDSRWRMFNKYIIYLKDLYSDYEFKVFIVTSFTNRTVRLNQLRRHNIYYDDIYFTDDAHKIDIIQSLNPTIVVEDCPKHLEELHHRNLKVKLFAPVVWRYLQKYNSTSSCVELYQDVEDLQQKILIYLRHLVNSK